MKYLKRTAWIIIGVVVLAAIGGYGYLKMTVPSYSGDLSVKGIKGNIEVIRDSFGMPHIYAENDADVYFGLGYCMAQDRLFQMEMIRRAARGRLAEILGEKLVPVDQLFRTVTASKSPEEAYEELPPDLKAAYESFTEGVNYYVANHRGPYPFEFTLMGSNPEPWVSADIVGVYYYMAWDQNYPIKSELFHAAIIDRVGEELAREIYIEYPSGYPTIISEGSNPIARGAKEILTYMAMAREITGPAGFEASNNWAISPRKSTTGSAILANDPHLAIGLPSIWYEAHLISPSMNVSGSTLPGFPFIAAGANEHVAWGMTNVNADDADFYLEKINPNNPYQYEYMGSWEDMVVKEEVIKVKNGEDVPIEIKLTRHGPIIDDVDKYDQPQGYSVSLRWTAPDFPDSPYSAYLADRAKNIDDIEKAAGYYKCFGTNWVYADDSGNIGFWLAMGIPIREGFNGDVPLAGWDGKHEWQGYVPTEEQPHLKNPSQGWVATANNKTVSDDYPYHISSNFATPDRFIRIEEMIEEKEKLGVKDVERIQADTLVVMARDWVPLLLKDLQGVELSESEKQGRALLEGWDFMANGDGTAPTVFHAFVNSLVANVFKQRLGGDLYTLYVGKNKNIPFNTLRHLIDKGESVWFDDPNTPQIEGRDALFVKSFKDGVSYLEKKMGGDVDGWVWEKLHTVTFYHPFGKKSPVMGVFMNRGPFPVGGSIFTVNPTVYHVEDPWGTTDAAGLRHIIDLSGQGNSLRIIAGGASGNFMSPYYDNQIKLWRTNEYRPFVLKREDVEKDIKYRMVMRPE